MKQHFVRFITIVAAFGVMFAAYAWYQGKQREKYKNAAFIAEGLAVAAAVKTRIAEYYLGHGRMPSSNHDLDLPEPEKFGGQSLIGLKVSDGGTVTLWYDEQIGVKNGSIKLIPDTGNPAMGITWRCVTSSYKDIAKFAPQCSYEV